LRTRSNSASGTPRTRGLRRGTVPGCPGCRVRPAPRQEEAGPAWREASPGFTARATRDGAPAGTSSREAFRLGFDLALSDPEERWTVRMPRVHRGVGADVMDDKGPPPPGREIAGR